MERLLLASFLQRPLAAPGAAAVDQLRQGTPQAPEAAAAILFYMARGCPALRAAL
jgi:hypothetical protein